MKKFFDIVLRVLAVIGLFFLGLFSIILYFFKWLGQNIVVFIKNTSWVRKTIKILAKVFEVLYAPIYYVAYVVSIVLRFFTCICYVLMFNARRAWYSFKLILK